MATLNSGVLSGQVAVITGASSGIGKGVAEALAGAGAAVCLAARRVDQLTEVKSRIEEKGGKAIVVQTDVTVRQQLKNLIQKAEEQLGPVNILINNAGVGYITFMENMKEDYWERTVDVNCKGVLNGIGAVLPGMIERKSGHIVNISSNAAKVAFPGLAVYTGSKFFVEGLSRSLRMEVKDKGIRVTCITPGDVVSNFAGEDIDPQASEAYSKMFEQDSSKFLQPKDIGQAVIYAVTQPPLVGVHDIVIEPSAYPFV